MWPVVSMLATSNFLDLFTLLVLQDGQLSEDNLSLYICNISF